MEYTKQGTMKVLMLPWLAHGHISPFLELAKRLSRRNFTIYLCSTPINLTSVEESLHQEEYSSSIRLFEINLEELPNLPPRYHTTRGLPPHLMNTLKRAFDESGPEQLSNAIDRVSPDLLIYDFLSPWAPAIARDRGIPAVFLANVAAGAASFLLHMLKNAGEKFPSEAICIPEYFLVKLGEQIEDDESGNKDTDRALQCFGESQDIILSRTFGELEAKYIDYLSKLTGKMVVPLGPLVQESVTQDDEKGLIRWLDEKERSSTVFVSFGTEYFLRGKEMEEIAYGLELSGVSFIWVIRFPEGEETWLEDALPKGFLNRLHNRGVVVEKWAPQQMILAHPSIGGFVSHCGWNSVMESLKYGVPIVAMPMHLDQPLNARVVDEVGVGVEVRRSPQGFLDREVIAKVVRDVLLGEGGERVRKKVKEISDWIINRGDDDDEITGVTSELIKLCHTN